VLYDLNGNKSTLREVATLQFTWLGAPTIYYGDEAGLTGATDPDDRRTFPWNSQDTGLESFYTKLISIRAANPALRDGSVQSLVLNNKTRIFSFERHDAQQSVVVALNDGKKSTKLTLKVKYLRNGAKLKDAIGGASVTVKSGRVTVTVPASGEVVLTPAG
jgi:glycosidase